MRSEAVVEKPEIMVRTERIASRMFSGRASSLVSATIEFENVDISFSIVAIAEESSDTVIVGDLVDMVWFLTFLCVVVNLFFVSF